MDFTGGMLMKSGRSGMTSNERILTSQEVPLVASATLDRLGQHSIGFVRVIGREEDAVIAGSGTLITAAGRHAILTADHVLEAMQGAGEIWLVICREDWTRPHRFRIDGTYSQKITVGKASHDQHGPDLGLVLLPSGEAAKLEAVQTFYNLDKRREKILAEEAINKFGWALFGMAHERTIDAPPEAEFSRVKGFHGLVGFGAKPIERVGADGFDYLDFVALYNAAYEGPESYQGTSGGGLWQLEYREVAGEVEVSNAVLSGVAYFESAKNNSTRTIYCHGRRSIYEQVYSAMTRQ